MDLKRGDTVTVNATVEAFRMGLNSQQEIRVRIGDAAVWVPYPQGVSGRTDIEETPAVQEEPMTEEDIAEVKEYIREELKKRLVIPPTID